MIFYVFYMFSMVLDERGHKSSRQARQIRWSQCQCTSPDAKAIIHLRLQGANLFESYLLLYPVYSCCTFASCFAKHFHCSSSFFPFFSFSDLTALMWKPQGLLQITITNNLYSNDPDCGVFECLWAYFHIHYVVQKPGEENVQWDLFFFN